MKWPKRQWENVSVTKVETVKNPCTDLLEIRAHT